MRHDQPFVDTVINENVMRDYNVLAVLCCSGFLQGFSEPCIIEKQNSIMSGRESSPRLEEQQPEEGAKEKRGVVPKMLQNGDVKGDGRFKASN